MDRRGLLAAAGSLAALAHLKSGAQTPAPRASELKPLGDERYQVGRIVVDKRARSFRVPGRVHALDKPLEYLATSPGGRKAYEALLELDTGGTEFNLACILVGLERDPSLPAWKPAQQGPAAGQRVALSVAWTEGDKRRQVSAAEALFNAEARAKIETIEWGYIGSFTSMDGSRFAADHTGTLISFIKDPTSIIEMVSGVGIGAYGSVRGSSVLPPEGTAIELVVEAGKSSK